MAFARAAARHPRPRPAALDLGVLLLPLFWPFPGLVLPRLRLSVPPDPPLGCFRLLAFAAALPVRAGLTLSSFTSLHWLRGLSRLLRTVFSFLRFAPSSPLFFAPAAFLPPCCSCLVLPPVCFCSGSAHARPLFPSRGRLVVAGLLSFCLRFSRSPRLPRPAWLLFTLGRAPARACCASARPAACSCFAAALVSVAPVPWVPRQCCWSPRPSILLGLDLGPCLGARRSVPVRCAYGKAASLPPLPPPYATRLSFRSGARQRPAVPPTSTGVLRPSSRFVIPRARPLQHPASPPWAPGRLRPPGLLRRPPADLRVWFARALEQGFAVPLPPQSLSWSPFSGTASPSSRACLPAAFPPLVPRRLGPFGRRAPTFPRRCSASFHFGWPSPVALSSHSLPPVQLLLAPLGIRGFPFFLPTGFPRPTQPDPLPPAFLPGGPHRFIG